MTEGENSLRGRIAQLEQYVSDLEKANRALRDEHLPGSRSWSVAKRLYPLAARVAVGPDLSRALEDWFRTTSPQIPIPAKETADVLAAALRRFVRVGLVAASLAILPTCLLIWQNFEIRRQSNLVGQQLQFQEAALRQQQDQIDQQNRDTETVRRAQLLSTIYECADNSAAPTESDPICLPRSHPRAREEAVIAFVEIERSAGRVADLSWSNLSGLDFRHANLRGINLFGADLSLAILPDLTGARIGSANLKGASLEMSALKDAISNDETVFPGDPKERIEIGPGESDEWVKPPGL